MGRKKKEIKLKESVRIRERRLGDGNVGLYLDMYQKGVRRKESLKLYLVPEVNAAAHLQNENTRKLAQKIKAERILNIQKAGLTDWKTARKTKVTLSAWMDGYVKERGNLSESTMKVKRNAQARLEEYLKHIGRPNLLLVDVDKEFCRSYLAFLKTCAPKKGKKTSNLSGTTQKLMASYFAAALKKGVREGLMERNPYDLLESKEKPKKDESVREYLTIEEVKRLTVTPCRYEIVKKAFLFSCFTALRYSDIKTLKWSEILTSADGKGRYIEHKQVKTKGNVTVPLSMEALKWMPAKDENEYVFHALQISQPTVETILGEWVVTAGIDKHITYHCSRHTAATMLLALGANLYVVSKILGHKNIQTTQIYAKIVDEKKVETMNLVNGIFD